LPFTWPKSDHRARIDILVLDDEVLDIRPQHGDGAQIFLHTVIGERACAGGGIGAEQALHDRKLRFVLAQQTTFSPEPAELIALMLIFCLGCSLTLTSVARATPTG
jgi:hypothetical protein